MRIDKDIIKQARQANLVEYLEEKHGFNFKKQGNRWQCIEHDSLFVTNGNAYYWNSKSDSGNSIDFLVKHLKMDFKDAVKELTEINPQIKKNSSQLPTEKSLDYSVSKDSINRAYAYLNKQRNIDNTIISNLIKKGYIKMIQGPKYKYPLIGFTIFDEDKKPVGYELQGTLDKARFKGLTPDVKYGYGFNITIGNPKKAFFFESAIDLLSFYELWKNGSLRFDLNDSTLISMAGLKANIVRCTSERFKGVLEVFLCVDSDEASLKFKSTLNGLNFAFQDVFIPDGNVKDWNEYLKKVTSQ